jgi:hypothetical protein
MSGYGLLCTHLKPSDEMAIEKKQVFDPDTYVDTCIKARPSQPEHEVSLILRYVYFLTPCRSKYWSPLRTTGPLILEGVGE